MLIGRLEIHVGRDRAARDESRRPRRCETPLSIQTSIVSLRWRVPSGKPERLRESGVIELEPDVRAALRDEVGQFANPLRVEQRLAVGGIKDWQRHAPAALARDHPVGSRFHRAGDAIFAPLRDPGHFW